MSYAVAFAIQWYLNLLTVISITRLKIFTTDTLAYVFKYFTTTVPCLAYYVNDI